MKGKTIAICLNPFNSHFLATLAFARNLQNKGNRVVYVGLPAMESVVQKEGFKYYKTKEGNESFAYIPKTFHASKYKIAYRTFHQDLFSLWQQINPDIILVGVARFYLFGLPSIESKIPILLYSVCAGRPDMTLANSPITSQYIGKKGLRSKIVIAWLWMKRFIRIEANLKGIVGKFHYPWPQLRRVAAYMGCPWKFGVDGFYMDYPVLIFGTESLEIFNTNNINRIVFSGLGVDTSRKFMSEEELDIENDRDERPLIYCTLGTMGARYQKAIDLYAAIFDVMERNPQWRLILSLGGCESSIQHKSNVHNLKVVKQLDQLLVLQYADMAIVHGGYGTVKECMYHGVPMLVIPGSYDQHGNAARVTRLQIGKSVPGLKKSFFERIFKRNIKKINTDLIENSIKEILGNTQYKDNLDYLNSIWDQKKEMDAAEAWIDNLYFENMEDHDGFGFRNI